ncbi:iron complex outermembrane receptor protein [Blastomonas natatoria]|uniref:Iron complex outermembrane receptor protein n=1 Tax=Blastomonas natatoria TaxID=34015 RepID=A0A2V3UNN3_9SPHN|nr:TonB-dependent receptor [Blastomonas natatoria]PXW68108.1 iron complex outermembrane receptor protein [Blastomonas natatoria]
MRRTLLTVSSSLSLAAALLAPLPVLAQQADQEDQSATQDDDFHRNQGIIVTAPFVRDLSILAGTSELSGEDLAREARAQIGDALTKLPGVSATSFSPGASRPVLRGFQGERIRVLTDGIGTIDVSNTSPDHGVTVEPIILDRIEVLRGPAVLLFGGQAVGGAVNAIDKRIPREVPEEPFHLDALATYGSAADERSIGASLDVPLTSKLVLHLDGSYRKSDDLRVGGFVLSPGLRAEQLEEAAEERAEGNIEEAEEAEELAGLRGRIPNTGTETYSFGGGLAYIGEGGSFGISGSYYNSLYGVPERPGAGHHHGEEEGEEEAGGEEEEGPVTIGLDQIKVDFRGQVDLPGFFEALRLRAAYADFKQTEFEGDEVGTVFRNEGIESRLELVQRERGGWRGASGVQYVHRDFSAIGAEAFVPPNTTDQVGIFTLQEVRTGQFELEGAARYDRVVVKSQDVGVERRFNSYSFALGLAYIPTDQLRIGVNLNRAQRAPAAEELFSNGPHIATQAFEIGNPNFTTEKSWGGEAYIRYSTPDVNLSLTGFYNRFDDFIIDVPTGLEEDELPVFQFIQNDAKYYGIEAEASAVFARAGGFSFIADGVADYVHASLDGLGPVPRIPPLRLLGGLEAQSDTLGLRAEVEWFADQQRNTAFETETEGFTLVNASASWKPFGASRGVTLIASANNIFDVVGRRAASFTKDFAPLGGRDFRVSARFSF